MQEKCFIWEGWASLPSLLLQQNTLSMQGRHAEDLKATSIVQKTDIDDVPHLADLLRVTFKEYQRRQRGPFLKQVARAAQIAKQIQQGPEAQLQVSSCS